MNKKLIIANWKLNGNKKFIKNFSYKITKEKNINKKCNIIIAPPLIYLEKLCNLLKNTSIKICAQNVDIHLSGPFTGETSILMLKNIGVKYVIIGHSERIKFHKENKKTILKKFKLAHKFNITPILCIGENYIEKKKKLTKKICINNINNIINNLNVSYFKKTIIAYEPTWAIGSKKSAKPSYIQKIHSFIRKYIASFNTKIAKKIKIQYGGSVNKYNIQDILKEKDVDGILLGSASLKYNEFISIIKLL